MATALETGLPGYRWLRNREPNQLDWHSIVARCQELFSKSFFVVYKHGAIRCNADSLARPGQDVGKNYEKVQTATPCIKKNYCKCKQKQKK